MRRADRKARQKLGELLVEHGLITSNQLKEALRRQAQTGGKIGSILVERGFITTEVLLDFLSKQLGVPSANLMDIDLDPDVLKLIPVDKIKKMKLIPIALDDNFVTLAMVNPNDMMALNDIEFSLGRKVHPVVVPSSQMETAINSLVSHPKKDVASTMRERSPKKAKRKSPQLLSLLKYLAKSTATDMLLVAGVPPSIKIHNELKRADMEYLTPADCERYARELMPESDWEFFEESGDHDFAVTYPDIGRFRVNVYRQRRSVSITLRYINEIVPTLAELNLPDWLRDYALKPQGLILVSGPAGHGKTTTLAAMVDIINSNRGCNIITLEDPIEYLHKHKKSNVNQREIGLDTESFSEGLRHIFRQDPDVIVIGELRDIESFEIALHAADTGHLVISTVHAINATSTIDRMINIFPPHQQNIIRTKLADSLILIFSQRLVPLKKTDNRIIAFEKLINSYKIRNLIREAKTYQIRTQMLSGTEDYESIDSSLARLYLEGKITYADGLLFSGNEQFYRDLTGTK